MGTHGLTTDGTFEPFIPALCFPSYPSAHASSASAAARIINKILGSDRPRDHADHTTAPQTSSCITARLDQITADIDDARVYGGIHFRFDQEAGARQGRSIGNYLLRTLMWPVQPELGCVPRLWAVRRPEGFRQGPEDDL